MKYRKSFVTNSSSSSYICDICGRVESGWDIGLDEADMFECVNGHVFCCDEALIQYDDREKLIKLILEHEWNKYEKWTSSGTEDITITEEELKEMDFDELIDLSSDGDGYYYVPEEFCPICNFIEYS